MQRQNFISRDFFVNAAEQITKMTILALPKSISDIKYSESNKVHFLRFLYQPTTEQKDFHVDVSLLPLNDEFTQVNLHISYTDGHSFYHDKHIKHALLGFETLIQAALKGDVSSYRPSNREEKEPAKLMNAIETMAASISGLFVWKKA